jgi:DNA-binding transcriptional regulator LsrR (DeoR family)
MTSTPLLRLMARVARLYHEQGLRQAEIADRLDLSQSRVSRLLKQAEREGIVRTTVAVPSGFFPELEERLVAMYGLREAIVADCDADDDQEAMRMIGAAAASYVETTVGTGELIGISSWSGTLLAMVDNMHPQPRPAAEGVVQLLGGVGNAAVEKHATRLTSRLAEIVGGEARFLPAPGVAGSAQGRRALLDDPFVATAMGWMNEVTLALVGIGALEPSKLLAASGNVVGPEEQRELQALGAVGDICLRFFDADGVPVESPVDDRVIGMELEQLKRPKRSVGLAGGPRKLAAIQGALRGRFVNVLITDRFTADRLAGDWTGLPTATAPLGRAAT